MKHYSEVKNDPKLWTFMQRVEFDIGCDEQEFGQVKFYNPDANLSSAEVRARGKIFRKQTLYRKGLHRPAEFRLTDEELIEKFRVNVSVILPEKSADKVVKAVFELEKLTNTAEVMEMLTP